MLRFGFFPAIFFHPDGNHVRSRGSLCCCMASIYLLLKKLPNINKNGLEHCNMETCAYGDGTVCSKKTKTTTVCLPGARVEDVRKRVGKVLGPGKGGLSWHM